MFPEEMQYADAAENGTKPTYTRRTPRPKVRTSEGELIDKRGGDKQSSGEH